MNGTTIKIIDGHHDLAWASRSLLGYGVEALREAVPGLHTDLPRLAAIAPAIDTAVRASVS